MPLFSNKPVEVPYKWTFTSTNLATPHDPAFPQLEASANSEVNKVSDFIAYKNMQSRQAEKDRSELSRRTGRIVLPPIRQKISVDHVRQSGMNQFVGEDWPSLLHDFGVKGAVTNISTAEYRFNFEAEKPSCFALIDPLLKHFEKLGLHRDVFADMLLDMRQTENELEHRGLNPHPKDKLGRKLKVDFEGAHLRMRSIFRYRFQHNFNRIADEQGAYIHIRFEARNQYSADRSAFNQDIVFVFPTSNEERDIWRHVFWNEEYPAAGFPVETSYARELAELNRPSRNSLNHVDKLAAEFSRMAMPAQVSPPSYDATIAQRH